MIWHLYTLYWNIYRFYQKYKHWKIDRIEKKTSKRTHEVNIIMFYVCVFVFFLRAERDWPIFRTIFSLSSIFGFIVPYLVEWMRLAHIHTPIDQWLVSLKQSINSFIDYFFSAILSDYCCRRSRLKESFGYLFALHLIYRLLIYLVFVGNFQMDYLTWSFFRFSCFCDWQMPEKYSTKHGIKRKGTHIWYFILRDLRKSEIY